MEKKRGKGPSAAGVTGAAARGNSEELGEACRSVMELPGRPLSGLAVVLLKSGRIAWEGYFGTRLFAGSGRGQDLPVDEHTRWRAASISKPIATLGAMHLVEKGLLDLDRDISEYLGYPLRNPAFPEKSITTRMLLGHTSSLRDADFYFPPLGHVLRDLFIPEGRYYDKGSHFALPDPAADTSPGSFYMYCNLGFALLGSIVENITGQRFDHYMKDTVFDPLEIDGGFNPNLLSDHGFRNLSPIYRKCQPDRDVWDPEGPWHPQIDNHDGIRPRLPVRIPAGSGKPPALEDYIPGLNGSLFSPQGGMRIRAKDLAKIAQLFIDGGVAETARGVTRIISEESVRAMMTPGWTRQEDGNNCKEEHSRVYATGIGLLRPTGPGGGPAMWGHRGNAYGFLGGMFIDRTSRSGYVYMIGGTGADVEINRDPASRLSIWDDKLGMAIENSLRSI